MKSRTIFGLFAFAVISLGIATLSAQSAEATIREQSHKVDICHATESDRVNPYVSNNVDDDAIDGISSGRGDADHNRDGHQDGEDIIPPFYDDGRVGSWTPRNWDAAGQAIFYNNCNTPPTVDIDQNCVIEVNGKLEITIVGASNKTTLVVTGPADFNKTIIEVEDKTMPVVIDNLSAGQYIVNLFANKQTVPFFSQTVTLENCPEEEPKVANITATAVCVTVDGKVMVKVTLVNSGDANGEAIVNSETVEVLAGKTVEKNYAYPANAKITVIFGGQSVLDKTLNCEPGQGSGETPTTTETPVTPVTPAMELPRTSGSSTPVVVAGASLLAVLLLGATAAIKTRFVL